MSDGALASPPVATQVTILNRAPVANAGGPYAGNNATASTIGFDGSASSDPDGDPLTYAWSFGDGATGGGPTPSHTYAGSGYYSVSLVVSDGTASSSQSG